MYRGLGHLELDAHLNLGSRYAWRSYRYRRLCGNGSSVNRFEFHGRAVVPGWRKSARRSILRALRGCNDMLWPSWRGRAFDDGHPAHDDSIIPIEVASCPKKLTDMEQARPTAPGSHSYRDACLPQMRRRDGSSASEAPGTLGRAFSWERARTLSRQGVRLGGRGLWRPQLPRAPGSGMVRLGSVFRRDLEIWVVCLRQAREDAVRGRSDSRGRGCAAVVSSLPGGG
ncbi:MAG: hypothetical protein RL385_1544 [Pseudomonadota bacterium]|jgi:hypothetical protein